MALEFPRKGQVIHYGYLWRREADRGVEHGTKPRPSAVILAEENGRVAVVPITHSMPDKTSSAIEIPHQVKQRLQLDDERSWIVTSEINVFRWPGYDLVPLPSGGFVFGTLPPGLTKRVLDRVTQNILSGRLVQVSRDATKDRDR